MNYNEREIIQLYLDKYGYVDLVAKGQSMFPNIKDEDNIRIISQTQYESNDIIAFWHHNKLIIHRVIYILGDKFFTKGDNNNQFDKVVIRNNVIGKAIKIELLNNDDVKKN